MTGPKFHPFLTTQTPLSILSYLMVRALREGFPLFHEFPDFIFGCEELFGLDYESAYARAKLNYARIRQLDRERGQYPMESRYFLYAYRIEIEHLDILLFIGINHTTLLNMSSSIEQLPFSGFSHPVEYGQVGIISWLLPLALCAFAGSGCHLLDSLFIGNSLSFMENMENSDHVLHRLRPWRVMYVRLSIAFGLY